jgi:hypothetical protein
LFERVHPAQWPAEIGLVTFLKVLVLSPDAVTALLSQMPIKVPATGRGLASRVG